MTARFFVVVGFFYKAFHVESLIAPFSHDFSVLFSIVINTLWEERAVLYASRVFVC